MRKRLVIADEATNPLRMCQLGRCERMLKVMIADAEQRKLSAALEQRGNDSGQEVEAFLPRQSAHDTEQECLGLRFKPESTLQRDLVSTARFERARTVIGGEM